MPLVLLLACLGASRVRAVQAWQPLPVDAATSSLCQARCDVPGMGGFASAETLVPDPANLQRFKRNFLDAKMRKLTSRGVFYG